MTRILFVESGTEGGGSFTSLHQHVAALDRDAWEPVVAFLAENRYVEPLRARDIPVYIVQDPFYSPESGDAFHRLADAVRRRLARYAPALSLPFLRLLHLPTVRAIERIVADQDIDLVHLNTQIRRDIFGLFAAERAGIPCISHLRSVKSRGFTPRHAAYVNRTVSRFLAVSSRVRDHWTALGLDPDLVEVVPNGVPVEDAEPLDLHAAFGLPDRVDSVVVCVENLNYEGGQAYLVDAFAKLAETRDDVGLLLVGEGPDRDDLEDQVRRHGLEDRVVLTGHEDRVPRILAAADVSVLPSDEDSMSRVVAESMLAGTAVVATDTGGIRDVVADGENGVLVPPADPASLAEAIARLLDDDATRRRLAEAGEETARDGFTLEAMSDRVQRIYEEALGEASHGR